MSILFPIARAGLFQLPAETAHDVVIEGLASLPAPARALLRAGSPTADRRLATRLWGIDFENPVGLAAGFDKAGVAFNGFAALGFGFVEIGTVTAHPQVGNPKPRVFRLPRDRALLNRMGFNNPGAEAVAARLARTRSETVLGVNVGKSKVTPLEEAVDDYLRSIALLERFARYLVINVSSPNTPGLRDLQDAGPLRALLSAVRERPRDPGRDAVPVLLKLAPDLTDGQIEQAVAIAEEEGVAGIVAVNTTVARSGLRTAAAKVEALGAGGLSGSPLRDRAEEVVGRIHRQTRGALPIIGVGGIFTAEDAWRRIRAGASLVQLYTGFVYEGPPLIGRIQSGLVERLEASGFSRLADVVGTAHA